MYFKKISALLLFFYSCNATSQELDVLLTNGLYQHQEQLIHPVTYKGHKLGLEINYTRHLKNRNLLFSKMNVSGVIKGENKLQNDMSQLNLNLEVGYLFKTKFPYWKTGVSLQAMYDYSLYSLNYEYPFWFTQYSLNWSNSIQIPINENLSVNGKISLPLFGIFSRTENEVLYEFKQEYTKAYFHQNLALDTKNNFQSISGDITIFKRMSDKTSLGLGYLFHFFNYRKPKPITGFNNSISLNFKLKW